MISDIVEGAGLKIINTCKIGQEQNIPEVGSSGGSNISLGNSVHLSQYLLRRVLDFLNEVEIISEQCQTHVLLFRKWFNQISMS